MIDWLTLRVVSGYEPRAGLVQSISADGEIEWQSPKRESVEGSHSSSVTLRTSTAAPMPHRDGTGVWFPSPSLEISGNPAKFLQGHNLFGSDDLQGVVSGFVRAVYARIGYEPPEHELLAIDAGTVYLTRVDINRNSDFGSEPRAIAVVRALSECGHLSHRGRGSLIGEGTALWGKGSQRWNLKAYAKRQELRKHPIKADVPMVAELLKLAEGIVRQEVTIRGKELAARGLQLVSAWGKLGITPRALFEALFERLTISEATMKEPAELDTIPAKLRGVYQLWADGHDLRELFSRATFYRHRQALLACGVDIAVKQPRETSNVVPLRITLVGREVGVPDWARGTSLYFDPSAAHRAA